MPQPLRNKMIYSVMMSEYSSNLDTLVANIIGMWLKGAYMFKNKFLSIALFYMFCITKDFFISLKSNLNLCRHIIDWLSAFTQFIKHLVVIDNLALMLMP